MNEWTLVYQIPLRVLPAVVYAFAYAWGGTNLKWVRRILGTGLLAGGLVGLSFLKEFNWLILPALIPLAIAGTMGYGADKLEQKLLKRSLVGLGAGLTGLLLGWVTGYIWLGVFQLVLSVFASVFLGVVNPTESVYEQALIGLFYTICLGFMV